MKLTPEQVALIEAVLTDYEHGMSARGIIVRYGFHDIPTWNGFLRGFRSLGISVASIRMRGLTEDDRAAFIEWLRAKHAQKKAESPPSSTPNTGEGA